MQFEQAVRARRSVRAFRPDPVPVETIRELLELASLAPSGTNIQPWNVHVVTGATRDRLVREVLAHRDTRPADAKAEFPRMHKRKEPYLSRMRTLGKDMYTRIGIPRGDEAGMWRQTGRNYSFFDAPAGLIITIDKELDVMSYADVGMFMQTFMLAAKDRGLDTCAQGAWNTFWTVTRRVMSVPEDEYIIAGIALGHADEDDPVNGVVATREPLETFVTFHD